MGTGSFPGAKRPGHGVDHPPQSNAEVKEKVELYLFFPSGLSWPVLGCSLHLSVSKLDLLSYTEGVFLETFYIWIEKITNLGA